MNNTYTKQQVEAAAKSLGFENSELMLAHFKAKLMSQGLYEKLKGGQK